MALDTACRIIYPAIGLDRLTQLTYLDEYECMQECSSTKVRSPSSLVSSNLDHTYCSKWSWLATQS